MGHLGKMETEKMKIFACNCKTLQNHRLIFDGGSSGIYCLELCSTCFKKEDLQFLISEEYHA